VSEKFYRMLVSPICACMCVCVIDEMVLRVGIVYASKKIHIKPKCAKIITI
jgi:type III secretory pathway component EscU